MGAGVSGLRIDAQVSKGPVIYSRPFHWPSETGAGGGGGWGRGREVACGGVGHHCLCSARPPLQVKEHGGGATGVTDLTFVCVCWMVLGGL